jgi:hypothetical protein
VHTRSRHARRGRRRLSRVVVSVVAVLAAATALPGTPLEADPPTPEEVQGQLTTAAMQQCTAAAEELPKAINKVFCTHGNDPPPPGIELGQPLEMYPQYRGDTVPGAPPLATAATAGIQCYGNGTDGFRVQPVYLYREGTSPNAGHVSTILNSYIPTVESQISSSATQTGGVRHVRWVTDTDCNVQVIQLAAPASVLDNTDFTATISWLAARGLDRTDRAYLMWAAASALCGVGRVYLNDSPSLSNPNYDGPGYARVDIPCWSFAETHELGHVFGAVQRSAPNSTAFGHCTDDYDLMCYDDDGPGSLTIMRNPRPCADTGQEGRFDCNNDDYFHTNPPPGSYLATRWNSANTPFLATRPSTGTEGAGAFRPLATPVRVVNTRVPGSPMVYFQNGAARSPSRLLPGVSNMVSILRNTTGALPPTGVGAVVMNVTVVDAQGDGFLSIRPLEDDTFGTPFAVSNVNYRAGQTVPNLVTVTVPADGWLEVFSSGGLPFVLMDVVGWYADAGGTFAERGGFHPVAPARIFNTRESAPLGPNATVSVPVTGRGGVPTANVSAVVLNVTAVDATASTFLTVWPDGAARPDASNLNVADAAPIANLVIARVNPSTGRINIGNFNGSVNVLVDVVGWYDNGTINGGAVYRAVPPRRVVDTRNAIGQGSRDPLGANASRSFTLRGGASGVPNAPSVVAVVANVTAVDPSVGGFFTTWASGAGQPNASTVNFIAGRNVPNLAVIGLSGAGQASVFNAFGTSHALIDVAGYFQTP